MLLRNCSQSTGTFLKKNIIRWIRKKKRNIWGGREERKPRLKYFDLKLITVEEREIMPNLWGETEMHCTEEYCIAIHFTIKYCTLQHWRAYLQLMLDCLQDAWHYLLTCLLLFHSSYLRSGQLCFEPWAPFKKFYHYVLCTALCTDLKIANGFLYKKFLHTSHSKCIAPNCSKM